MNKSLVVVESPAKARTVGQYLGENYTVLASYGHVRDLLPKSGAIDTENDFAMQYQAVEKSAKAVNAIAKALKASDALYLATDPDREGEAIAWHLTELLNERGLMQGRKLCRVVFHEVTREAIKKAIEAPKDLSMDLINAQQARRALDYLVGFNLSPLLWKKIQRGLSAGRVQSPALRMIVEREKEIEDFKPREYWTIEADLKKDGTKFVARLTQADNKKIEQFSITSAAVADKLHQALLQAANGELTVNKINKKQQKQRPPAPFITSTLQQEAVRKLGMTTKRTMRTAQQLYEGVSLGDGVGSAGLITYMRTDSFALAKGSQSEIRDFIIKEYGEDYVPGTPPVFKKQSKNAQEAHEAIRPTSVKRIPANIKDRLSNDQFRLYELIWRRAVASQMAHAIIDTVAVDMNCGEGNIFRANGSTVVHPGFKKVYYGSQKKEDESKLPLLEEEDRVELLEIRPGQHFTEPPPRYTEASLVKTLEEYGIGRPSTYASIIDVLKQREYVEFDKKKFTPTSVGCVVNDFLTNHFSHYVDYDFTSGLEDELDAVSRGEKDWLPLMKNFWQSFGKQIKEKEATVSRDETIKSRELGVDPKTGKPVLVRIGRFGPYAQIGTKEDQDKPVFASLLPQQKLDTITLEEALALFQLPRVLGETDQGEEVASGIGRFGPYIRYGDKFISLDGEDPYTVSLEKALELVALKKAENKKNQINVFEEDGIKVLNGRYGPYITDGGKNVKIPKDLDPAGLTLEECKKMLSEAPKKKRRRGWKKKTNIKTS